MHGIGSTPLERDSNRQATFSLGDATFSSTFAYLASVDGSEHCWSLNIYILSVAVNLMDLFHERCTGIV